MDEFSIMDDPEVQLHFNVERLSPSQGRYTNSIIVFIDEIIYNQTTNQQTLIDSNLFNFNIRNSNHRHINLLLHDQLDINLHWLCEYLASHIEMCATNIGFGHNGFLLTIQITITTTYHTSSVSKDVMMRLVLGGRLDEEELKSLKMESESCSICLENLSGSNPSVPTRMICSHVFHDSCLLDWFQRKNTCPLCRTVLYDR